nr:hypothetical protein NCPCFENI_01241 [Cupriavidus sp.]
MVIVQLLNLLHHGLHAIEELHIPIRIDTLGIEVLRRIARPFGKAHTGKPGGAHKVFARLGNQRGPLIIS